MRRGADLSGFAGTMNTTNSQPLNGIQPQPGRAVRGSRLDLAHHWAFFGSSALLFFASAALTIYRCNSMSGGMEMPGGWSLSMAWMRMPGQSWFDAAFSFLGMWVVMMVAMMLPVLTPALLRYRLSTRGARSGHLAALTMLAGAAYVSIWAVIGAALYPIGAVVTQAIMASEPLARSMPVAAGAVLLFVGYLQFTPWKARLLCRCRAAAACEKTLSWDARSAWRFGIRLGGDCALCCSGLTAVLLVNGIMNVGTMALVTVAVAAERSGSHPQRVARTTGLILIAAAAYTIGRYWSSY